MYSTYLYNKMGIKYFVTLLAFKGHVSGTRRFNSGISILFDRVGDVLFENEKRRESIKIVGSYSWSKIVF